MILYLKERRKNDNSTYYMDLKCTQLGFNTETGCSPQNFLIELGLKNQRTKKDAKSSTIYLQKFTKNSEKRYLF